MSILLKFSPKCLRERALIIARSVRETVWIRLPGDFRAISGAESSIRAVMEICSGRIGGQDGVIKRSNLIPEKCLRNKASIQQTLEEMVRERAGGSVAKLANPINVGLGTK